MKNTLKKARDIGAGVIVGAGIVIGAQQVPQQPKLTTDKYEIRLSENGNDVYMAVASPEKQISYGRLLTEKEKVEIKAGNEKAVGDKLVEESIAVQNK